VAVIPFLPTWFWETRLISRLKGIKRWTPAFAGMTDRVLSRLPRRPLSIKPSPYAGPFILFSLLCVACWDMHSLYPERIPLPGPIDTVCQVVNLKQAWGMFSPNITKTSGWFVIPGKLADGSLVDLNHSGSPVRWAPPPLVSTYFKNERRRKFLMNMRSGKMRAYEGDFSRYLCGAWNASHSGDKALQSLEVIFVNRDILDNYKVTTYRRTVLWEAYCSAESRAAGPPLPYLAPKRNGVRTNNSIPPPLVLTSPYAP